MFISSNNITRNVYFQLHSNTKRWRKLLEASRSVTLFYGMTVTNLIHNRILNETNTATLILPSIHATLNSSQNCKK